MYKQSTIISAIISGILLITAPVVTPAAATDINIGIGLDRLFVNDNQINSKQRVLPAGWRDYNRVGYRGIPVRRIRRNLRRRGLYQVSRFRRKNRVVMFRAENRRGTLFKVVASARSGRILNTRRIHGPRYRPPVIGYGWNEPDWGYNRHRHRGHRGTRHHRPNSNIDQNGADHERWMYGSGK